MATQPSPPAVDDRLFASYLIPMALLPIITAPDPRLKLKAKPVTRVDDRVRRLMDDMLETMYDAPGIGLAAPQVGEAQRVIVVDCAREGEKPQPLRIANPEILWRSDEIDDRQRGLPVAARALRRCGAARRRSGCAISTTQNEIRELDAKGLLATCIQHEMDHLDGVLFVDHISSLKRGIILRKLAKAKRQKSRRAGLAPGERGPDRMTPLRLVFMGTPRFRRARARAR